MTYYAINAKEVYKMLLLPGQKGTEILRVADGVVRLCYDTETDSCSIGLRTTKDVEWKYISKELHDLLVKELAEQEGGGNKLHNGLLRKPIEGEVEHDA